MGRRRKDENPPPDAPSLPPNQLKAVQDSFRKMLEALEKANPLHSTVTQLREYQHAVSESQKLQSFMKVAAKAAQASATFAAHQEAIRQARLGTVPYDEPVQSFVSVPAATETARPRPPEASKAVPEIEKLKRSHAPPNWRPQEERRFRRAIQQNTTIDVIVLAADIRRSTTLMKEAIDPHEFASTLGDFTDHARRIVWEREGLFDKFTGDGFLAYWSFTPARKTPVVLRVLEAVRAFHAAFVESHVPRFRANSQNFPGGIGLAIGLDEGATNVVSIAGDTTIVGPPVVGAVRMVSMAQPRETLANVRLGEHLGDGIESGTLDGLEVTRIERSTSKEYDSQSGYAVVFGDLLLEER